MAVSIVGLRTLLSSQSPIARVNPSNQSLLVSDSEQKRGKLVALLLSKSGQESILMLPRYLADLVQSCLTVSCQMKGIQSPVIRVCSSLHEPSILQMVQDRHQPAGINL